MPAIVISALVLLVIVPGRTRRGWALVLIVGAVAAISGPVLHVFEQSSRVVTGDSVRDAAVAIIAAAVLSGALWGVVTAIAARSAAGAGSALRWAPRVVLVACVLAATGVVLATVNDPAGGVSRQYDAFTKLQNTANEKSRFLSGGGNRYDYWRVAMDEFRDEPLRGVGAGSYQFAYFLERRTPEDIRQPHSLELQALAELGVVGGRSCSLFILAVLFGLARRASLARRSPRRPAWSWRRAASSSSGSCTRASTGST